MDAELVERIARGFGVWWDGRLGYWPAALRDLALRSLPSGQIEVTTRDGGALVGIDVDVGTVLVLMLGHARELRVDLGECPACRERGSRWEHHHRLRPRPGQTLPDTWLPLHGPLLPGHPRVWARPCPTCTVDGKPTGRRTVPWAQAVLDAMPLTVAERSAKMMAALDSDDDDSGTDGWDGDPGARAALAVLADRLQGDGDPLGTILTAWLRGPCGACDGQCSICDHDQGGYMPGYGCSDCMNTGHVCADPCHGHGTVLGALAGLVHAEAVRVAEAGEFAVWRSLDAGATSILAALDEGRVGCGPRVDVEALAGLGLIDDRGTLPPSMSAVAITPFGRRVAEAGRRALAPAEASP